jgi:hypothetical protein
VRIVCWPAEFTCYAVKTTSCPACGTRIRSAQTLKRAALAAPDGSLDAGATAASLLARVREWKASAEFCERCPERVALESS